MKLKTTKAVIATVLATVFAGATVTAIAQNTGAQGEPRNAQTAQRGGAADPARQAEMQKRMDRLKTLLQITPAQEAAWKAYTARVEPTPPKAPAANEDWSKLTTPQRLEKMQALHDARHAEMNKRIEATKSFYAQLTPAQQKSFDTLDQDMHRAGMKGEHRQGGHEGRGGKGHQGMGGGMGCEGGGDGPMGGHGPRS